MQKNSFCVVNVLFAQPVTVNKPKRNAPLLILLTRSSLCTAQHRGTQRRASAQGLHLLWYGGRLTIEHILAKLGKMV